MKQGSNKRSRGRGNRKPSRSQVYDSNGPEGRIRGNANQVYDKYLALGRDAYSSGDRIAAENFFQHAEHYYRIMMAIEATRAQQQDQQQGGQQGDRSQGQSGRRNNNDGDDRSEYDDNVMHDPRDPVPAFDDDDDVSADSSDGNAAAEEAKPEAKPARRPSRRERARDAEQQPDAASLPEGLLKPVTPRQPEAAAEEEGDIRHSSGSDKPRTRRPRRRKEEETPAVDQSAAD
jgi:hypothetical protein